MTSTIPFPATTTTPNHQLTLSKATYLLSKSKILTQTLQIHAALLRHNLNQNPQINFKLQKSYSSFNHLTYAVSLFNQTDFPNVYFYTSLMHAFTLCGLHRHALGLYVQMLLQGVQPNAFTYSALLRDCPVEDGKVLHGHVVKVGVGVEDDVWVRTGLLDVYARGGDVAAARRLFDGVSERSEKSLVSETVMITCYVKNGDVDEARAVFEGMEERDVVCWNAMINGYVQVGKGNESLALFRRMLREKEKVRVNEGTVVSVLSAIGQLGALESGKWMHSYMEDSRNGIRFNVQVSTALVDMYCKCGSLEDARVVFDGINLKDVVAWNSMILGYAMHGFSREALELFNQMMELGFKPTEISFINVLRACSHAGLVEEGRSLFNSMLDEYGIDPKIEHYGCMVDLLGRAGLVDEAFKFVNSMKIEPDAVIWGTLLGACRLHKNVLLGENIANFLVQNGVANSGTYILLSNLYAEEGNWEGVAKMRTMLKESGVQKEPGCSSIEVHNKVHEFVAGDLKHPKSKRIYGMLKELDVRLKAHGYSPQTDIVLHDIEERYKEHVLGVHSERLAISYGLISTRPGTTITIVKNLRICTDCHTVSKLISKITGRKIVVRDRNRFHHFADGSCSCGDYW